MGIYLAFITFHCTKCVRYMCALRDKYKKNNTCLQSSFHRQCLNSRRLEDTFEPHQC